MRDNFRNTLNLIEYISKPMDKSDVLLLYRVNNVIPEKSELYLDFTKSLFITIVDTYLGDDVINGEEDMLNHFNWCWEKVLLSFEKEKIKFNNTTDLYTYFKILFIESFYEEEDKTDKRIENSFKFWEDTLSYQPIKTRIELETFMEVYKLFDKSIK